jgi:hypothetical protein
VKVTFEIDDGDDAANAVAMCRAIYDAIALHEAPGKLRERLDQAEKARGSFEESTAVAEPVKDPTAPVKETRGRKKKPVISNPHDAGTTDIHGNYTPEPEAARDQLRIVAKERGVVWMRELLATHGASRLGDLTDSQVANALAQ